MTVGSIGISISMHIYRYIYIYMIGVSIHTRISVSGLKSNVRLSMGDNLSM